MTRLQEALVRLNADLTSLGLHWALVGDVAMSVYAEPRLTRYVGVAVAVSGDKQAEQVVYELRRRGYRELPEQPILESVDSDRLATTRLLVPGNPGEEGSGMVADVLFSFPGVEPEVVRSAETHEVFAGVAVPVIRSGELLAVKIQAGRAKDLEDARNLLRVLGEQEVQLARDTLLLIEGKGFARGRDLLAEFADLQRR